MTIPLTLCASLMLKLFRRRYEKDVHGPAYVTELYIVTTSSTRSCMSCSNKAMVRIETKPSSTRRQNG